jgi:hypothetical protein
LADAEDQPALAELEVRKVEKAVPAVPAVPVILQEKKARITLVRQPLAVTAAMVVAVVARAPTGHEHGPAPSISARTVKSKCRIL